MEITKLQNISALFDHLKKHGIEVKSMRNKTNRLEEIFLSLLEGENHEYKR